MSESLVLASGNRGKLRELQQLIEPTGLEALSQADLDIPEIEETGLSFVENAILKARNASLLSGLPALADDSGLEVDFLRGQPGIYSARFSGPNATDASNNSKLLRLLEGRPTEDRVARFQCVVVYLRHGKDPSPIICQGSWDGSIMTESSGTEGFGYDPIFWVKDHGCSAAELPKAVKNRISHRGQAMQQLLDRLGTL